MSVSIVEILGRISSTRLNALFAQDPRRAADWVYATAAEGVAAAQVCYGRMLLEGTGVDKNAMTALLWFRRAARNGDIDGVNMVGRCLDNGWGCVSDTAAAAACFERAGNSGHAWAQYNAGHMYLDGRGVARDQVTAFGWYLRAALQGHERAMNLLGRCCEEGWGTHRDAAAAADWYRRSAEGGYFRGQYNWATLLLKAGRTQEACVWFERAARGGNPAVCEAVRGLTRGPGAPDALAKLGTRLPD